MDASWKKLASFAYHLSFITHPGGDPPSRESVVARLISRRPTHDCRENRSQAVRMNPKEN